MKSITKEDVKEVYSYWYNNTDEEYINNKIWLHFARNERVFENLEKGIHTICWVKPAEHFENAQYPIFDMECIKGDTYVNADGDMVCTYNGGYGKNRFKNANREIYALMRSE